jgi:transposase-like protein
MKTNSPKKPTPILGIACCVFGHNYKITRKVTDHINEYKCHNCEREFTDNLKGNLEVLTSKTKALNTTVSSFIRRRMRRTIVQST